MRPLANSAAGR